MALRHPPQKSKYDDTTYWAFHDAPEALGKAYALSPGTLIHRLVKLGAPTAPFEFKEWRVSPLHVFEGLYKERCRELGAIPA